MNNMKKLSLLMALVLIVVLLASCNGKTPKETDVTGKDNVTLGNETDVVTDSEDVAPAYFTDLALSWGVEIESDEDMDPITFFPADLPEIYVIGVVNDASANTVVSCKWFNNDQDPALLLSEKTLTPEAAQIEFNFGLVSPEEGWTPGNYSVELYINGQIQETINFQIIGMGY